MDPVNQEGTIAPFTPPRHGFPLIAGGILKPVSFMAYVDYAKCYVAMSKNINTLSEFFSIVQGYCDLLADLSLVFKMGRNVRKCTIYLYNIPEGCEIPEFTSIAWSYDALGPVKGKIAVVVMKRDNENNHLICYQVPKKLRDNAPYHIKSVLALRKYLGVPMNAQLDATEGKEIFIRKLSQHIGLVVAKADSIQEARISHNMSSSYLLSHFHSYDFKDCAAIDKQIIKAY